MATVIFDFDSTLISCENLETIMQERQVDEEKLRMIRRLTDQGMSGEISFGDSFEQRMRLSALTRNDFIEFGQRAYDYLTPGIEELIEELQKNKVDLWVISGANREALLPLARRLKIPQERIVGVEVLWSNQGEYAGIDPVKTYLLSKCDAAKRYLSLWSSPSVAVGDGMTDYELYRQQLVEHFIAFTKNVRRQAVIDQGVPEAHSVEELRRQLGAIIYA